MFCIAECPAEKRTEKFRKKYTEYHYTRYDFVDKQCKLVNILSVSLLSFSIVVGYFFTVVRYLMVNKVVYNRIQEFVVGGALLRSEGAKFEAQGRERGIGSWKGTASPLLTSYRVWRSTVSSPSGVRSSDSKIKAQSAFWAQ